MKQLIPILFLLLAAFQSPAQDKLTNQLKEALQLAQKSSEHADEAANELGFYQGSADLKELKYHLYQSRIAMDSLLINAQKTEYKVTDASYTAQDQKNKDIQQKALLLKSQLKETTKNLQRVMKEIDLVFTNTPYNLDTYLYQPFQEFGHIQKQLQQIEKDLKSALKTLAKTKK